MLPSLFKSILFGELIKLGIINMGTVVTFEKFPHATKFFHGDQA